MLKLLIYTAVFFTLRVNLIRSLPNWLPALSDLKQNRNQGHGAWIEHYFCIVQPGRVIPQSPKRRFPKSPRFLAGPLQKFQDQKQIADGCILVGIFGTSIGTYDRTLWGFAFVWFLVNVHNGHFLCIDRLEPWDLQIHDRCSLDFFYWYLVLFFGQTSTFVPEKLWLSEIQAFFVLHVQFWLGVARSNVDPTHFNLLFEVTVWFIVDLGQLLAEDGRLLLWVDPRWISVAEVQVSFLV